MGLTKEQSTISLQQAQDWIARWKEGSLKDLTAITIKAFLIPGIDVTEVLAEQGVQDVRAYIGVDKNHIPHLLIVGVDKNGNDMIDNDELVNVKNGWNIYDFTLPCPSTCDVKSPLYRA
ncbi:hypothetical protein [Flavobacterium sp. SM2513]|uniref:hypothetical protein n=1 Tax=Flavobacterium sp. SM2513 TaxID=3424766 RepID=UPI003D7F599A